VSIAEDTTGEATEMRFETREVVLAALGMTSVCPGSNITSS
jgi:hypothetical protein